MDLKQMVATTSWLSGKRHVSNGLI